MPFSLGFWAAAGAGGGGAAAYELISTTVATGSSSEITFSSIPATYKHLQVRFTAKNNSDSNNYSLYFRMNGDTSSNYTRHELIGTGSSVVSEGSGNQSSIAIGLLATNSTANSFTAGVLDLLDYTSATNYKTVRLLTGGSWSISRVLLSSGLWRSTSAVTSFTIGNGGLVNFANGSRFSLYGIKGA